LSIFARIRLLCEKSSGADIRVLQIRRGIPVQDNIYPTRNVIGHPVLREISIFHRAIPISGQWQSFRVAQVRIFFLDDFARALAGFSEDHATARSRPTASS